MIDLKRIVSWGLMVVVGLIGLSILFGSWYTIDQRERGVILRNGALTGIAKPGLNFKLPIIDDVVKISLEQRIVAYQKQNSYSRDQQNADIDISVNFRVIEDQVDELYTDYGSIQGFIDRRITPKVIEELKNVFGTYNAVTVIQQRAKFNADVQSAVMKAIQADGRSPVLVTSIQTTNIDFSNAYEQAIEQRMLAEVEVDRLRQNLAREKVQADIKVTQAQAVADSMLAQARAQAEATRVQAIADAERIELRGNAEAKAIHARGQALNANPALVNLVQAERWDGKLPTTMVPGAAVPMIGLGR
jgi:regulator of protease activity HflC (stomatin/prohibitin superfamily)